ncbi:MAG: sulfatase-like hydrolase/transferase [Bacteroidales bacterium]|nr:sulfatase-like hydrolase/transferase [Bacteroidales bacterium]
MKIISKIFINGAISSLLFPIMAQAQEGDPPNVIFMICDDLNDYEGVFGGHPQAITPHMDALATLGIQFVNAASNCPVSMPSRNSLFTGVYPHDSKDFGWIGRTKQPVLKYNKPLMQLFSENGYHLAGSGKLMHEHEPALWDEWGLNKKYNYGPIYYDGNEVGAHPGVPSPYREIGAIDGSYGDLASAGISWGNQGEPGWVYGNDLTPFRYVSETDRDLMQDELHAQWAVEKLQEFEAQNLDKPFFMGIGFVKPHTPLHAPKKYFDMYPLEELELADWLEGDEKDTYYKDNFDADKKGLRYYRTIIESYDGDKELALKKFLQAYLACVTFVDEQIGLVMEGLENSKYKDNTIVVLTTDHGWQMGEKQYLFKNSAWEESARVPLVIKTPDTNPGGKVEHPVSLIDLYPTLVDLCGLEGNHKISEQGGDLGGFSLRPFLENPDTTEWEGPEGALTVIGVTGANGPVLDQNYSLRTKDRRYILYKDGSEELYDHRTDVNEWYNLAYKAEYIEIKKDLKKKLLEMISGEVEPVFQDDFESYPVGTDLETISSYKLWGQNGTVHVSDDTASLGPYEGKQFALTNAFWAALVVPLSLSAGRTYKWSVASKVEIEDPADSLKRARSLQVKSDDFVYLISEVDISVDDWVVSESKFSIEEGLQNVNFIVTGSANAPMGVDNFFLYEEPVPYLRLYYDGEIIQGEEEGEIISLIFHNDAFSQNINESSWTVEGLPEGISYGNIVWIDSSMVQFELIGNAALPYNEVNDTVKIGVSVLNDQFVSYDQDLSLRADLIFSYKDTSTIKAADVYEQHSPNVYPNPAITHLNIAHETKSPGFVDLISLDGRPLLKLPLDPHHMRFTLPEGLKGMYLLRIHGDETVITSKVIINN